MVKRIIICFFVGLFFGVFSPLTSCFGDSSNSDLVGKWRTYSSRIFYDIGGGGSWNGLAGHQLELALNGTWNFGTSVGTFSIQIISNSDWKRWNISPYGPKMKIVLSGWNGTRGEGPIEESNGRVDFIWVIYPVVPPLVQNPGTVWIKFGH